VVDISNLHRQHYFEKNIGEKKANVLAEHLKEINNNIEIKTIHCLLNDGFSN
jgi:molybdopterin/thiamine biosynthesis adenylyltransferase